MDVICPRNALPSLFDSFHLKFHRDHRSSNPSSNSSHKDKHGSLYIQVVCAVDTDVDIHTDTHTDTNTDCKHFMSSSFRRRTAVPGTGAGTRNPRGRIGGGPLSSSSQSPAVHVHVHVPVLELVGTKPWVGGATLTSSGLREFDAILGGGQPLGTAMLIEEDRWTQDLALALVRYWAAEVSTVLDTCTDDGSIDLILVLN